MSTANDPDEAQSRPVDRRDELLVELGDVCAMIHATELALSGLYAHRLTLFRKARALDPPITQRVLADVAGVSEVAVINAVKKAERNERARAEAAASA